MVLETGAPVIGVTVTVLAASEGRDVREVARVGSVATDSSGRFRLEYEGPKGIGALALQVVATAPKPTTLYEDAEPRRQPGEVETWALRIPVQQLTAAGLLAPKRTVASDLPALGSVIARAVADASFETETQNVVRQRVDPRRASAVQVAEQIRRELLVRGRAGAPPPPINPVATRVRQTITRGLNQAKLARPRRGFAVISEDERASLTALTSPDGSLPASAIEHLLFGEVLDGPRTTVDLFAGACRRPRTLAEACAPTLVPDQPPAPPPAVDDLATAVWTQLRHHTQDSTPRGDASDLKHRIDGLRVTTGPADAPALYDFSALHVPIEDVWVDLLDEEIVSAAGQLFDELDRLGGRPSLGPAPGTGAMLDHLRSEASFLIKQAPAVVRSAKSRGPFVAPVADPLGLPDPLALDGTAWVSALLAELERKLNEPYRFTVYGADDTGTAINFGLITTYRQTWTPINYQAGRLIETLTLAPREERTYTRKVSTTTKRRVETKQKAREVLRSEETRTQRAVRDIVETAELRTGLEASGGLGALSGSLKVDDARTSSDTRQQFREAVIKAAREYEQDRSIDVSFETSVEATTENTGKLSNPNDELAVTFLFYQLQRRFHVTEHLHRVTPVLLVAQPVPKPNQINLTWILQHDWILRRVILDPSFIPALDAVNTSLVGEEATVGQLRTDLEQQRAVIDSLRQSLHASHAEVEALFRGLSTAIDDAAEEQDGAGWVSVWRWLKGGGDEEANRARAETAREALERAEARQRALAERLDREAERLANVTDRWVSATRALLDRTVEVQRLRLHLKQNILYYMQAIWDHEPPDQRLLRLHDIPVPVIDGELSYRMVSPNNEPPLPPHWTPPVVIDAALRAQITGETVPLGELADLDRPLGYRGNYAIFPMREAHLIGRYLMVPYADRHSGAHDPDHLANLTRAQIERYSCCLREFLSPSEFETLRPGLEDAYRRILSDPRPLEEEIVVPTDALFIEALPGDRPILEDFKLRHRAADTRKAEAEAARINLENLRRGARILSGNLNDPELDRRTLIQGLPAGVVVGDDA
ncbi:MAG: hypothetical protein HS111_12725 [Kofleriaceae bacterium]|nr:hypothetical protein [Kofleriaceae bacterium]